MKKFLYCNYNKEFHPQKYLLTNLNNQAESHDTKSFRQFKKISKAKIKFSVNRSGKDKNWDYEKLSTEFENTEGTVETVLEAVKAGYAINGAWFKGRRKKANVLGVQLLLVDIDNTTYQVDQFGKPVKDLEGKRIPIYSRELTIEDAIAHPFVQKYCAFIYTTASHKPDWHKLRLGFILPEVIDRETYESLASIVLKEFPHDPACKDAGRVFFGNSNTEIILCNSNVVLDSSFIEAAKVKKEQDAIARKEKEVELQQRREEIKREWLARGKTEQDLEQLVREALSYIPPRQPGSGNYNDCLKILTALKNEFGDSRAIAIASGWSPSTRDWNLERKISGLNNSTIGIGTIFHFAKENGWQFPKQDSFEFHSWENYLEPDKKEYQEYCSRLEEEARIEEADTNWRCFKDLIIRGKKKLKGLGFGKATEEKKVQSEVVTHYKKHERLDTWGKSERKFIIDSSQTGSGKSFDAGRANPEQFKLSKIIYITNDPRNVTTSTLNSKEWAVNQGRHNGLFVDDLNRTRVIDRSTAVSLNNLKHLPGNCVRSQTIGALASKNIKNSSDSSLICGGCPYYGLCKSGTKYKNLATGYLGDRSKALSSDKIVSHPSSLPSVQEFDYGNSLLIWDEWSESFDDIHQVSVTETDLQKLSLELIKKASHLATQLSPLFCQLDEIFNLKAPSRWGWSHEALVEKLKPSLPNNIDLTELLKVTEPDLNILNPTSEYGEDIRDLPNKVKKDFWEADNLTAERVKEKTIKQWIVPFLEILLGKKTGYLSKSGKVLKITTPDTRLREIAQAAGKNIFMDATGTRLDLAARLGVNSLEIDCIAAEQKETDNLKVVQVTNLGRLGQQRGKHQQKQTAAITKALKEKYPDLVKVSFKSHADQGDLRWFLESRGANDAEQASALVLEGVPCPNIEALKAEFTCRYGRPPEPGVEKIRYPIEATNQDLIGTNPYLEIKDSSDREFREFVRKKILSAIKQGLGRLRANRRPGEELVVYFLGDYPLDFPVELITPIEIAPEAASKKERFELALTEAIAQLQDEGKKVTQTALAQITGYSQQYLSKFKKLLLLLIDSSNSKSSKKSDPPPRS